MDTSALPPNTVLASLSSADFELVRPHLRTFEMVHRISLVRIGDPLQHVFFPHSGAISLVISLVGGETIETAMVGSDSVFGGATALDGDIAHNEAIVQLPGMLPHSTCRISGKPLSRVHRFAPRSCVMIRRCMRKLCSQSPAMRLIPLRLVYRVGCRERARSVRKRQARFNSRVLGPDARRAAHQRLSCRQHASAGGAHSLRARSYRDKGSWSFGRIRLRMLRSRQGAIRRPACALSAARIPLLRLKRGG